jgi:DNA repair protein RadA/Sms
MRLAASDRRAGGRSPGAAGHRVVAANRPLPQKLVVFGEVGLAGEIRPAPRGQERLREAAKLGFTHAMMPKANAPRQAIKGLDVIALDRVEEAIERMRHW